MARFLDRPGFLLARIDQICTSIHADLSSGETLAQAELLMLVDRLQPVAQIALARAAGVDKSTTAYVIDNLEAGGWVERATCRDDRRRALVSLTATGRARVPDSEADFAALQRRLASSLDAADLPRLVALLRRLAADPDGHAPQWVPAADGLLDSAPSFLARRVLQRLQAQFVACTPGLDLTLRQFSLLFILGIRPEITQVAFARMFGLDPSTCAVIMRGLAARGLIAGRRSARDGRERVHAITERGRAVLAETQARVDRSERLVFRDATAAERRWLVGRLQRIVRRHSHRLRFPGALGSLHA